jgi:hypothetical protein
MERALFCLGRSVIAGFAKAGFPSAEAVKTYVSIGIEK